MDSVIAKLDDSVFGMLVEQPPHILITDVKKEDLEFINRVRPDFVCLLDDDIRKDLSPVIKVIDQPDDLPVISGVHDPRAMKIDIFSGPDDTVKTVKKAKPDTVVLELKKHDEDEYSNSRKLIRAVRSIQPEMTD